MHLPEQASLYCQSNSSVHSSGIFFIICMPILSVSKQTVIDLSMKIPETSYNLYCSFYVSYEVIAFQ